MQHLILSVTKEPPIPDFEAPQTLGSPLIFTFVVLLVLGIVLWKNKKFHYFIGILLVTIVGFGIGLIWFSPMSLGFAIVLSNVFLLLSCVVAGLIMLLKKKLLQARTQQ